MSKYDPLKRYLTAATAAELPLGFQDVERVLGFPLPPSARKHREWWSNNVGTHVGARAWREAGWKTERVDMAGERLVFVRDPAGRTTVEGGFRRLLTPSATRLLEERAEYHHDEDSAIAELLNAAALDRRRRLIERFAATSPDLRGVAPDSTAIIREDRDDR